MNGQSKWILPIHIIFEKIAVVYKKDHPLRDKKVLEGKKISVQMGSTMEIWIKKNIPNADLSSINTNNQAIEGLKIRAS